MRKVVIIGLIIALPFLIFEGYKRHLRYKLKYPKEGIGDKFTAENPPYPVITSVNPERYCESNNDCKAIRDYCNCEDRCVNKNLKFENCQPDTKNCKFGSFDTLICYCQNNRCVEGPRE